MQPSTAGLHQLSGSQRGSNVMYEVGTDFSSSRADANITQSDGITILYTLLQQLSAGWRVQQCMGTALNLVNSVYSCSCCYEEHYSELIRFLEECANEGRRRLMELRKSNAGKDHAPSCHRIRDPSGSSYPDNSGVSSSHLVTDTSVSVTPAAVPRSVTGSVIPSTLSGVGGGEGQAGISLPLLQSLSLLNSSSNGGISPSSVVSAGGSSVVVGGAGTGTVGGSPMGTSNQIPNFFSEMFLSSSGLVSGGSSKGNSLPYGIDSTLNTMNRSMNMKDVLSPGEVHMDPTALFNHASSASAYAPNIPPPNLSTSLQAVSHHQSPVEATLTQQQQHHQGGGRISSLSSASTDHYHHHHQQQQQQPALAGGSASSVDAEVFTSISLDQEICGDLDQLQHCTSSPQQSQQQHQCPSSSSQQPSARTRLDHHLISTNATSSNKQPMTGGYWESPTPHYGAPMNSQTGIASNVVGATGVVSTNVMSDVCMIWDHWFPAGQQSPQGLYRQGVKSPHQRIINADMLPNYATSRPQRLPTTNNAQTQRKDQPQRKLSPQGSSSDAIPSPSRRGLPHISTFLKADGGIPNFQPSPALFASRDPINSWNNTMSRNWGPNGKKPSGTWNSGFVDFADDDSSPGMTSQLPHISTSDLIGILRQYHKNEITRLEAKIRLHDVGSCKPCAFFHFPKKLCNSIKTCHFCHHEEHRRYSMKCWKRRRQRITKDITPADLETVNSLTNDVSLVQRESQTFYREADFIMACRSLKLSVEGSFPSSIKPLHQYYLKAEVIEMVEQGKMNVESINQDAMLPEEEIVQ